LIVVFVGGPTMPTRSALSWPARRNVAYVVAPAAAALPPA
jgi:hypothetical protein